MRYYAYKGKNSSVSLNWMNKEVDFEEVDFENNFITKLGRKQVLTPWQITTLKLENAVVDKDYSKVVYPTKSTFKYEHHGNVKLEEKIATQEDIDRLIIQ